MNVVYQIEKLKEWQHEMDEAWRELEKRVSHLEEGLIAAMNAVTKLTRKEEPAK